MRRDYTFIWHRHWTVWINAEVPLGHDLLQISIREGIPQTPPNAKKNDYVFEMPSRNNAGRFWITIYPTGSAHLRLQQNRRSRPMAPRTMKRAIGRTPTVG